MPATTAAARAMRMLTTTASSMAAGNSDHHVSSTLQFGRTIGRRLMESALTTTMGTPTTQQSMMDAFTHTTTTTTASTMMDTFSDQLILNEQQAEIGGSSLYEEFSRMTPTDSWTAPINALLASFSVILVSELGDKTFIITAIMAMKNSRSLVFISSALALLSMTILSVGMGVAVTVIPKVYTHYASIVLFLCFGLKMLKEAFDMKLLDEGEESEFEEVKRSLEEAAGKSPHLQQFKDGEVYTDEKKLPTIVEDENRSSSKQEKANLCLFEAGSAKEQPAAADKQHQQQSSTFSQLSKTLYVAPIVIKVFTMVFIAEWGDRSQISTVILAAREDVVGVFVGSLTGHVLCTGLAVIGGRFVAEMISVRTMTLLGGIIFLFFATFAILTGPEAP